MAAWMEIDGQVDFGSSYIRIIQSPSEPYADSIGRSKDAIEKQVKEE